ncbi:hypothetical protein [Streptomyces sp. WAC 04229]|uniref:hypothetical protein n=1 Tax=Streptomyces sp. WAC 04229 TaxID=2203206 RepID=UPI00163C7B13|nr:hypothetical protein [Streptomyces sp. WAC 04229]
MHAQTSGHPVTGDDVRRIAAREAAGTASAASRVTIPRRAVVAVGRVSSAAGKAA